MAIDDNHSVRVVDQFTRQASSYARLTDGKKVNSRFDRMAFIDPKPVDTVLDVACGTGSLALSLAEHVDRVTGIDLTPAMLDQARGAQLKSGVKNVNWQIGDAASLRFGNNSFSLVVCGAAFHHMEDPLRVLEEMRRVCSPGGRILVNDVTPAPEKAEEFDYIENLKDPSHTHALSLEELRELGLAADLEEFQVVAYLTTLPLEFVLSTNFPEDVTIEELVGMYKADALNGEDRYGINATLEDENIIVSYPMSAVLWEKPSSAGGEP